MLGRYWPDQSTRRLLEEFAMTKDEYVCSVVLRTLAERWPDQKTMQLLERHVESFEVGEIRRKIERAIESLWKKLQAEVS